MYPFFELTINDEDDTGVQANAFVDYPAHMKNFVAFGKKTPTVKFHFDENAEGEERVVLGVMISSGTPIYRMADDTAPDHYVIFKADTVKQIHTKFHKQKLGFSLNEMHDPSKKIDGVFMEQSYLIGGDKNPSVPEVFSNLNLQDGTWIATYKVENDEIWDKVKDGTFGGFSIEGLFERTEIKVRTKGEFKMAKGKFGTIQEISKWDIEIDQDPTTITEGMELTNSWEHEDGTIETWRIQDGEYTLPDGQRILVDSDGIVRTIFKKQNKNMKKLGFFASLAKGMGFAISGEFAEVTTVDGVVLIYEGELAEGTAVFVDADGENVPAPEGPHQVEIDGTAMVITLDENGLVTTVEEVDMDADPEGMAAEFGAFMKAYDKKVEGRFTEMQGVITKLEADKNTLETKVTDMENFSKSKFQYTPKGGGGSAQKSWKDLV